MRQSIFSVAAVTSGVFYFMVIRTLLTTQQNARKVALVRAFLSLYVLWLVCFIPYDVLELYYLSSEALRDEDLKDFAPVYFKEFVNENQQPDRPFFYFQGLAKRFIIVEACLGNLRVAFGFLNSVILLVLLKPFREPPKKIYGFLIKVIKK